MSPTSESSVDRQIAELADLVSGLEDRVRQLESTIRKDHEVLEADHQRIVNLEHTGPISVKPVGL